MARIVVALFVVALAASAGADDDGIGITVEARDVPGSSLPELYVTAYAPVPPSAVARVIWAHERYPEFLPEVKRLDVLRDDGDERLLHQWITMPVVEDRDVVLRTRRTVDRATGTVDVRTMAVADEGPPPTAGSVRIPSSVSHWHLAPTGDGGCAISYSIRTDLGGLVPSWVVSRGERTTVPKLVHAMISRAVESTRVTARVEDGREVGASGGTRGRGAAAGEAGAANEVRTSGRRVPRDSPAR